MYFFRTSIVLILIVCLAVIGFNQDDEVTDSLDPADYGNKLNEFYFALYSNCADSIVSVTSKATQKNPGFLEGSGFFVNDKGYVLTAYDNVKNTKEAIIRVNRKKYNMEIAEYDAVCGWAVLKPIKEMKINTFLKIDKDFDYRIADSVSIISNALYSVSLSGKPVLKTGELTCIYRKNGIELIETDCELNSGCIGAPLVNIDGKVIGICLSWQKQGRWLTLALPAKVFVESLQSIK